MRTNTWSPRRVASPARLALYIALATGLFAGGCASVRPYEKEHLADSIMQSPRDAKEAARELKWIEAREGSNGGTGGAGGGCACK